MPSLLSDLIDLHAALRADRAIDLEARRTRDRRLGAALQGERARPARQLRAWLGRVEIPQWRREGERGAHLYRLMGVTLAAAGLLSGWGLARAVLHYTGAAPINVLNALVVLILPQLALLLLWGLNALPVRLAPIGGVRSLLGFLNPGRLARALAERLTVGGGQRLQVLWDADNAVTLAPAARWLVSLWSQLFSVGFNLGVLGAMAYLIAFSDLAFGWSTTLQLRSATFHAIVQGLAAPWAPFAPEAVPSAALVEASRYYRLEGGADAASREQAALLGTWWRFLVAAVVCYGLLPRLVTLAISWQRLHHHLANALVRLPGAPELLARMNSPLVSTAAPLPEVPPPPAQEGETVHAHPAAAHVRCALLAWSGSIEDGPGLRARLARLGIEAGDLLHAGGARSIDEDRATVARLCAQRDEGVAIVVKSWEPPLLEFADFVQQVRARCGRGRPIIVLLWGGDGVVEAEDLEVWRLTLRPLKDPDLHVEAVA